MSRRRNQLARSLTQANVKKVYEFGPSQSGKSKGINLVVRERRSLAAAKNIITPLNAGEKFTARLASL